MHSQFYLRQTHSKSATFLGKNVVYLDEFDWWVGGEARLVGGVERFIVRWDGVLCERSQLNLSRSLISICYLGLIHG